MNKNFEKNRLDLAYQKQLHYLNGAIILSTIGVLSFIGNLIWNKNNRIMGIISIIIIGLIVIFWHNKIDKNLKEISNKIKNLS